MKEPKTKVVFRIWPKKQGGDVIALFPAIASTVGKPYLCQSYQHIGQHGAADPFRLRSLRLATPAEYRELARELRGRGYRLDVRQRMTRADLEARKEQVRR